MENKHQQLFGRFDKKEKGYLNGQELLDALRITAKIDETKLNYIISLFSMCGMSILKSGANFMLFRVLLALAIRVKNLDDKWFNNVLPTLSLFSVEKKILKAKKLWSFLVNPETKTLPINELLMDFEAAKISDERIEFARSKFANLNFFDIFEVLPWFLVAMYNLYFFAPLVNELTCNSTSYSQCRGGPPLFMGLYAVVLASVDGIILNAPLILSGLIGSSLAISLVTVSRLFNLSVFCLPLINHSSATRLTSNRYAGWLHEFNKVSTPLFLTSIPILLGAYFFFITYGGIGAILGPNLLPSTMYILISFALYFSVNRSVLHVSSCNPKLMAILLSLLLLCYIFGIVLIMHLELLSLYSITILQCSAFLLSSLVVAVLGLKSPKKTSSNLLPGFD